MNILSKEDLLHNISIMKNKGIFASENLIDLLISSYILGDKQINGVTKSYIFLETINLICEQIRQGAIHSKWVLGNQLILNTQYLPSDKVISKFLIELSAFENEPNACEYMADKYLEFGEKDIANFWLEKSQIGFVGKTGASLNIYFNSDDKYIYFKDRE